MRGDFPRAPRRSDRPRLAARNLRLGDARAVVRGARQSVFEDTGGVTHSSMLHHDVSSGQGATLPIHCPNPAQLDSTHVDSRARAEPFRAKFQRVGVQGRGPPKVVANAVRRVRITPVPLLHHTSWSVERRWQRSLPRRRSGVCGAPDHAVDAAPPGRRRTASPSRPITRPSSPPPPSPSRNCRSDCRGSSRLRSSRRRCRAGRGCLDRARGRRRL